ncbi:MAG: DUF1461 domain-containing protein [Patescibacteria group bacterium]
MANKLFSFLIVSATVVLLLGGSVFLVIYDYQIYEPLYSDSFKTGKGDQQFLTELAVDYISGIDVSLFPFEREEKDHLDDVRALVSTTEVVTVVSLVLLILLIPYAWFYKKEKRRVLWAVWYGSLSVTVLALVVVFGALVQFDNFFTNIHYVLFPQGGWAFGENSLLLLLFPQEFFFYMFERIVMFMLMGGALVWLVVSTVLGLNPEKFRLN